MLIYCVRHGESAFNAQGRIQGQADISLSPLGERQSRAVARAMADLPITALFASPLRRAMQTAQPIAEALGLPIQTDDRLKEIHAGIFQTLRWDEIEASYPEEAKRWLAHEPDFVIPGGESRRALMHRGREAFDAIRATEEKQVLVVAHGGLLSAVFKSLLEIPVHRNPFSLHNCSISRVGWDKKDARLLTLNQIDHLHEVNGNREGTYGDL